MKGHRELPSLRRDDDLDSLRDQERFKAVLKEVDEKSEILVGRKTPDDPPQEE